MLKTLDTATKKHYRSIGHKLKPVVMIAANGLTPNILDDIDTRLEKNELIKIKLLAETKAQKQAILERICSSLHAQTVQQLGHTALLFRAAEKPDPKLSNLLRVT